MGPRDQGLGAVAAVHLAVGRQGMAVVWQYPRACQESGRTVRGKAQPRGSGNGRGALCGHASCPGPGLLEGGREAASESPTCRS